MTDHNDNKVTEVHGGRFYCEKCGASWVGTWHGPKEDITCVNCEEYLFPDLRDQGLATSPGGARP